MNRCYRGVGLARRLALIAVLCLVGLVPPAGAQAPQEEAPPPAGAAEIDALVETLEDPEARARLIEQLELLRAARDGTAGEDESAAEEATFVSDGLGAMLLGALSEQVASVSRGFTAIGTAILALPDAAADLVAEAGEPEARQRWLEIAGKLVLVLGVALVAEWIARRLLRRPGLAVAARGGDNLWVKVPLLAVRLVLLLMPVAAFIAAGYLVLPLVEPRQQTSVVALTIINAIVVVRVVRAVAQVLLAPRAPQLRLLRVGDETAHYTFIWVSRLAAVIVYGYFLVQAAFLLGLPPAAYELLLRAVGLLAAAMLIVLVLQNRAGVAEWMRGRPAAAADVETAPEARTGRFGGLRNRLAEIWHVLAIVYIAATFVIWALDVPGGFEFLLRATVLTVVVLAVLKLLLLILNRVVRRGFAVSAELRASYPALEGRANRFLPVFERVIQVVLYVLAALWLLEVWGVDSFAWLGSDFGRSLTGSLMTIVLVLLASVLLLEIMDAVIERYLAPKDALGRPVTRSARVRTLLPLLRNAMRVLVAVMVTLIVLSELGVNIAPLLAGAGVVGLAIGFGAQTLVKDIITGFFILAEDQISVGDVVDLGGNAGVVEAMTIRTIRLRDLSGSVYTIPFGSVAMVKNLTKDFAYAKFDIGVAYDSDVDEVIEIMREVAAGMREDEAFRFSMMDDLEVMGLNQFADSALMLLARIKTPPGQQWTISREFNRRLKRAFDARGIEIPFPQRTVHMVTPPPRAEKPRRKEAGEPGDFDETDEAGEGGEDSPAR